MFTRDDGKLGWFSFRRAVLCDAFLPFNPLPLAVASLRAGAVHVPRLPGSGLNGYSSVRPVR